MRSGVSSSLPVPRWRQLRRTRRAGLDVQLFAEEILRGFEVVTPPIDVDALTLRLGVSVRPVTSTRWSGAVNSNEHAATIWLRADDAFVRRRFTLAHELGHLMLHDVGVAYRDDTFSGSWREVQANRFAAAFLMPSWMVVQMHHFALPPASFYLAPQFQVSQFAMRIRIAELTGQPLEAVP